MPARPYPLRSHPPPARPEGIPDGLWHLPERLAEVGNKLGKSQAELAAAAGTTQSSISRWLHYDGLLGIAAATLLKLEANLGIPHGLLTRWPPDPTVYREQAADRYPSRLSAVGLATAHGLDEEAIQAALRFEPNGPDPGAQFWWRLILAEAARLMGQPGNDGTPVGIVANELAHPSAPRVKRHAARIKHK